jgi:phage tail sheath protein FI
VAEFLSPGVFIDEATLVTSTEQFYKKFGDLSANSFTGHSVLAFFANGGRRCFVVRVMPNDSTEADVDIQSKVYDQTVNVGDGSTVNFTDSSPGTPIDLLTTIIGYNGTTGVNPGIHIRWRAAGTAVTTENLRNRDDSADVDQVGAPTAEQDYEFRIDPSSLPALAEGDYKQFVVDPSADFVLNFDPDGSTPSTITVTAPSSGTVGTTTTSAGSVCTFDFATGYGSVKFVGSEVIVAAGDGITLTCDYTPTTTTWEIRDDGSGNLVDVVANSLDTGGTNTIDYNDGSYDFDTQVPSTPHDDAPIIATYSYQAWDMDPVSNGDWANQVRVRVSGNADYFDATTQSYSKHDVAILEYNTSTGEYDVVESYDEVDFTDSASAEYFPDVINELSDLVSVDTPGGDAYPGTLDGWAYTSYIGGGDRDNTTGNSTFGGTQIIPTYINAFDVGARSVSFTGTLAGTAATGTIVSVALANYINGEYVTLNDGVNPPVTFWFDTTGAYVPPGGYNATNIQVDISGDTTDITTATTLVGVINSVSALLIYADNTGGTSATVDLVHLQELSAANNAIIDNVVDVGFTTTGMSGGADASALSISDDGNGNLTGDVDPTYATQVTVGGVTLDPNTIDYDTGYVNFKTSAALAGGSLVGAMYYVEPEETSHTEQFGDTTKQFTDSLAVVHYSSGSNGTFTSTTYTRGEFTNPTLQANKRGLYALDEVDEILQVIIPDFAGDVTVTGDLLDYAASRANLPSGGDRFIILTVPVGSDPQEAVDWFRFDLGRFSKWAAIYWPWIKIADPLANGRTLLLPPMGHIAGIYARTDNNKNVGKAPAGTVDGALNWLTGLEYIATQGERDFVYPNKINPLISSPQTGLAVWGARTISQESEWRYVHARRLFMFMEKSVYNSTGWIVFENNGEQLWSKIKGQIDGFMSGLYNQGMFFGASPQEAYFVIVDATNNDASTIEAGQVIIDVGAAPNRPAEFVRFRFQQATIAA